MGGLRLHGTSFPPSQASAGAGSALGQFTRQQGTNDWAFPLPGRNNLKSAEAALLQAVEVRWTRMADTATSAARRCKCLARRSSGLVTGSRCLQGGCSSLNQAGLARPHRPLS